MTSEAAKRPYAVYESYVIDRLIEAGCSSPRFLAIHHGRIEAAYRLGRPPEEAVDTMCDFWRIGVQIGADWSKADYPRPKEQSKAMQDTKRFLDAMKRKGLSL